MEKEFQVVDKTEQFVLNWVNTWFKNIRIDMKNNPEDFQNLEVRDVLTWFIESDLPVDFFNAD